MFLLKLAFGTWMSLSFISKCHLHVQFVYCMQCLPWWFNNNFLEIECSELGVLRGFLGTSSHKPTDASEVDEREVSSSSSTERPPGQTLGSWDRGAGGVGNESRRGPLSKLVTQLGQCLQIPEVSRFFPGVRAGPALLFAGIQRRENATDGPGRRHPGAGRGGSQRSAGGHRSCRAGREGGRRMVVLSSGRTVARVLGVAVPEPWIQGSADAPSPGRSCEHFDDPTGRGGRKGERRVFERSGFNSIGILFLTPQMTKIWIHRWNEESNPCDFLRVCFFVGGIRQQPPRQAWTRSKMNFTFKCNNWHRNVSAWSKKNLWDRHSHCRCNNFSLSAKTWEKGGKRMNVSAWRKRYQRDRRCNRLGLSAKTWEWSRMNFASKCKN